jgi:hypothetical protein
MFASGEEWARKCTRLLSISICNSPNTSTTSLQPQHSPMSMPTLFKINVFQQAQQWVSGHVEFKPEYFMLLQQEASKFSSGAKSSRQPPRHPPCGVSVADVNISDANHNGNGNDTHNHKEGGGGGVAHLKKVIWHLLYKLATTADGGGGVGDGATNTGNNGNGTNNNQHHNQNHPPIHTGQQLMLVSGRRSIYWIGISKAATE